MQQYLKHLSLLDLLLSEKLKSLLLFKVQVKESVLLHLVEPGEGLTISSEQELSIAASGTLLTGFGTTVEPSAQEGGFGRKVNFSTQN